MRTSDHVHIGVRIRHLRRRRGGMSQRTLAELAGVSQPYVSQLETGVETIDRYSTLVAFARALQVTVSDLRGLPGDPTDPARADAMSAVPQIRIALFEVDAGAGGRPTRSRDEVVAALNVTDEARRACDFATVAPTLPQLLRDAAAYGPATAGRALHGTAATLRGIGHKDLAWRASDMSVTRARDAGQQDLVAACEFTRFTTLPRESATVIADSAREKAAEFQPGEGVAARRGYGAFHLVAALAEAQAGNRSRVGEHLTEARDVAESLGDPTTPDFLDMSFGPTNVGLWWMAAELELGEWHRVVEIARDVHPERLPFDANRQSTYWMDLGRAQAHLPGRDREAIGSISRAELLAPQHLRAQPPAQDAVTTLIRKAYRRAVSTELRELALRVGVSPTEVTLTAR